MTANTLKCKKCELPRIEPNSFPWEYCAACWPSAEQRLTNHICKALSDDLKGMVAGETND